MMSGRGQPPGPPPKIAPKKQTTPSSLVAGERAGVPAPEHSDARQRHRFVPFRVREANASWRRAYGMFDTNTETAAVASVAGSSNRRATTLPSSSCRGIMFSDASILADVTEVDVEFSTPPFVFAWSLGPEVSQAYRQALADRRPPVAMLADASTWPPRPPCHCPNVVWRVVEEAQRFLSATCVFEANVESLPPQELGAIRFVSISDTHGNHRMLDGHLPPGDVLLHAGDFTMGGQPEEVDDFAIWLRDLPYPHKLVIAGNHERSFDPEAESAGNIRALFVSSCGESVTYLEDDLVSVSGVRVYGSPWQPEFGVDWAFNLPRGPPCADRWKQIPENVDVLMTHGPPLGRGDRCKNGMRAGCADLLAEVQGRVKPSYCVFGHVHEGFGATSDGTTTFINASSCDFDYRCVRPPLVFDVVARNAASEGCSAIEQ
eukprot:TRINITY_DN64216_c0_g1_i1.p1 TRINITY_DN64216_c0_g1~~TRINITY_DN64216_c0_g1_i1.p1  ORF type:complete len:432 (+),score=56.31 TRINITY_DN64216_c0_g1_i1:106-1401(+)